MTAREPYASSGRDAAVREIVRQHLDLEGAVLPILHAVQERFGSITEEALGLIAEELHLTPPQLYAVATYYNDFRLGPQPEHRISLCRGPSCRANGSRDIRRRFEEALGIEVGETTPDNRVALGTSGCMGLCAHGPAIQVDHAELGRVTLADVEAILAGRHPRASLNGHEPANGRVGAAEPEVRR